MLVYQWDDYNTSLKALLQAESPTKHNKVDFRTISNNCCIVYGLGKSVIVAALAA